VGYEDTIVCDMIHPVYSYMFTGVLHKHVGRCGFTIHNAVIAFKFDRHFDFRLLFHYYLHFDIIFRNGSVPILTEIFKVYVLTSNTCLLCP